VRILAEGKAEYLAVDPDGFRAYVRDRYGTAENAQAFWQANGWY